MILNQNLRNWALKMDCVDTLISKVHSFGMTSDPDDDFNNIVFCGSFTSQNNLIIDKQCDLTNYVNEKILNDCINKNSCNFNIDLQYMRQNCKYSANYDYFYFTYSCYSIDNIKFFLL